MKSYIATGAAAALAMAAFAADVETGSAEASADAEDTKKSIVPSKYAGKYKDGGSDALANFIKEQCVGKEGFEFQAFFALCRKNGIAEEKVAHYESLVAEKAHGAEGRARMTLRNMLATFVRKNGKLIGLDDAEHELSLPKPAVSGAAAKAKEQAAAAQGPESEPDTQEDDGSDEDGEDTE